MWKVDIIDLCRREVDVNYFHIAVHDEGRFFDDIVPDADDQVGPANGAVHLLLIGESGGAQRERVSGVQYPDSHLSAEEGDACLLHESAQCSRCAFAICSGAGKEKRRLCVANHGSGLFDGIAIGCRAANLCYFEKFALYFFLGNVLR